jgi:hypothetical protein
VRIRRRVILVQLFFPFHHSDAHSSIRYPLIVHISLPDPTQVPDTFGDYLKSVGLQFAQTVFDHYQSRPSESNGRVQEVATLEWCERMDALLVSPHQQSMLSTETYIF